MVENFTEEQFRRKGIKPYEQGFSVSDDGYGVHYSSAEQAVSGIGFLAITASNLNIETLNLKNEEVHSFDEQGGLKVKREFDLLAQNYGDVIVSFEGFTEDYDELDKKGSLNVLVWMDEKNLLLGELHYGAGSLTSSQFKSLKNDLLAPLYVPLTEQALKNLNFAFESRQKNGGEVN